MAQEKEKKETQLPQANHLDGCRTYRTGLGFDGFAQFDEYGRVW